MSRIRYCPNPDCPNHTSPTGRWYVHIGSYTTAAHGTVPRVRCTACGRTMSTQTFSIHYYAKRRLPLRLVSDRLRGGSSLRDIGRSFKVSRTAIRSAVYRLGRQAMAGHARLIADWQSDERVVFDGLQTFLTSQDYPVHLTTTLTGESEFLLDMTHTVLRRGGRMRPAQKRRRERKERVWKPRRGALSESISRLVRDIPRMHAMPNPDRPLVVDTDELAVYRSVLRRDAAFGLWFRHGMALHRRTPGSAARTMMNPLFPVNYFDMLLRHRVKEHTRETIAFGRHGVDQMHRAWIMAFDHNYVQPWRVRLGSDAPTHGERAGIDEAEIARVRRMFFRDRIDLRGCSMTESMWATWRGEVEGPPVRWKSGASRPRPAPIPAFALRDLARCTHF